MINTNVTDYAAAIKIGNDFKKLINDKYKKLEIDTDAVFQRMLLLQKKKYAAVKVEEDGTKETEIKGLDMKRREYCELSKGASRFVLGQILSGEDTETVIEAVHNFLAECGESIRAGKIPLEEYIIYKVRPFPLSSSPDRPAATWEEPPGLPRRKVAPARPGRDAHEGQGSDHQGGRRNPLHLLSRRGRGRRKDGQGGQGVQPRRDSKGRLRPQDWCVRRCRVPC